MLKHGFVLKNKFTSLLLTGILSISLCFNVSADTADEIAAAQAEIAYAESSLAQTQANISSMESKKAELENYLWQLNAQYDELTAAIEKLSTDAAEKAEELKKIKKELKKAKAAAEEQYENMKLRIVYMYEQGGTSFLKLYYLPEVLRIF